GNAEISDFLNANPALLSYAQQLPLVIVNIVVFILGVYLFKFLTYPIYAMLAHFLIPKQKKDEEKFYKQNKHRFFGGVVGAVQGLVLVMVLFMPLTSINTLLLSIDQPVALASYAAEEEPAEESFSFLKDVLGLDQEMIDYIYSYNDSFFVTAIKATKLDAVNDYVFNQLATIEVEGTKVRFFDEAKLVTDTYVQASKIIQDNDLLNIDELNETGIIRLFATLNYTEIEALINNVFKSGSVNVLGDQLLAYVADFVRTDYPEVTQNELAEIETLIDDALNNLSESNMQNLKSDILAVVHLLKVLQDHDLFAFATTGTYLEDLQSAIDTDNQVAQEDATQAILDFVLETVDVYDQTVVTEIVGAFFGSETLKTLFPDVVNVGIGALNRQFGEQGVSIALINPATLDWDDEIESFGTIFFNLKELGFEVYDYYCSIDNIEEFTPDMLNGLDIDISRLGTVLNTLRSMQLVSPIYEALFNQILLNPQIGLSVLPDSIATDIDTNGLEFIDFMTINWATEIASLQNLAYEVLDVMEAYNYDTGEMNIAEIDIEAIKTVVTSAFNSSLVKEFIYQVARVASVEIGNFDTPDLTQLDLLLDKLILKLDDFDVVELKTDINKLLDVVISLRVNGFLDVTDQDSLFTTLESLTETTVVTMIQDLFAAPTINEYFPDILNIMIELLNRELTLDVVYATNIAELSSEDIELLGEMLFNIKQFAFAMSDLTEDSNFTDDAVLDAMGLDNLGLALNALRDMTLFDGVYEDLINKVLLGDAFIGKILPEEIASEIQIDPTELDTIDWVDELQAVRETLTLLANMEDESTNEIDFYTTDLVTYLENNGNSTVVGELIGAVLESEMGDNLDLTFIDDVDLTVEDNAEAVGAALSLIVILDEYDESGSLVATEDQITAVVEGLAGLDAMNDEGDVTALVSQLVDNAELGVTLDEILGEDALNFTEESQGLESLLTVMTGNTITAENLVGSLADSPVVLNLINDTAEEGTNAITLDSTFATEVQNYLNSGVYENEDLIAQMFGLTLD
ncbi:MAG: hypothetical protein PHO33_01240, partial [Clostridia bacterium]|nr:hypothetical protein [Clostridia bacterium]